MSSNDTTSTLDVVRENDARGPSLNHTDPVMRSIIIIFFCHFSTATGDPNLAGGAETKRPREKSFISAISQIQNEAKKSSTRVTSEVRKCPKTHFCRFSFSRNSHFCNLRKN